MAEYDIYTQVSDVTYWSCSPHYQRTTNLFREVCFHSIENLLTLEGTVLNPEEIDESYFHGRRKYNRSRMLQGDLD